MMDGLNLFLGLLARVLPWACSLYIVHVFLFSPYLVQVIFRFCFACPVVMYSNIKGEL